MLVRWMEVWDADSDLNTTCVEIKEVKGVVFVPKLSYET